MDKGILDKYSKCIECKEEGEVLMGCFRGISLRRVTPSFSKIKKTLLMFHAAQYAYTDAFLILSMC